MDAGYRLILSDIDGLNDKTNDFYIYFFNSEDIITREKYLLLCSLFIITTCCGVFLCMIKDIRSEKNFVYNVVESDSNI